LTVTFASTGTVPAAAKTSCPPGTTMQENYMAIDNGSRVPGSGTTTSCLTTGKKETLTAPKSIPGANQTAFAFLFWDINGRLYSRRKATFIAPSDPSFEASAWYLLTGPGCCGPSNITTYGFSVLTDKKLPGTPVASTSPSSAWTSPSHTVFTKTAVTVTAGNPLELLYWRALPKTATVDGTKLSVAAGVSTVAIAFYGANACQSIQNELSGLSLADFPPHGGKALEAEIKYLSAQYQACVVRHGG